MRREITPQLEFQVVEILSRRGGLGAAAEKTGLTWKQVNEVAMRHGYPDLHKLTEALPALRGASKAGAAPVVEGEAAAATHGRQLLTVPVADLNPDPDNPRADLGEIEDLADSIRESGLLQPIVARRRGDTLIIVAGHRRHAALLHLGVLETEVVVSKDMRSSDVLAAMLIENGQRRDLDAIEEARAYQRLMALNSWNAQEVAKRVGRGHATVVNRLALLNLSAEQQEQVRAGEMGVTHGAQVGRERAGTAHGAHATYRFHLSTEHPLAGRARARCKREHGLKARIVGHTGCGECWESVIRADEQRRSLERSIERGECLTCEQPVQGAPEQDEAVSA